jgi:spore coat polysaccharide biosynthesis protein SpsF
MKVVVVVQARLGSSRLPGKVLLPLAGAPLLQRMLERVLAAREVDEVVVATTRAPRDEPLRELGRRLGLRVVSGHESDLLDRHRDAAQASRADVIVKVPSDCPLIDPAVIDRVVASYRAVPDAVDFVTNLHPPTWPDGNDVEVMPVSVLEIAWHEARRPFEREHTTPFVWDQPERFRLLNVESDLERDLSRSHRFTIDYPEDYALIERVYAALWSVERPIFSLADILAVLDENPDWLALNARWTGHSWHLAHLGELATVAARPGGLEWRNR